MLGAMTPRHGRRRTKQAVTVETEAPAAAGGSIVRTPWGSARPADANSHPPTRPDSARGTGAACAPAARSSWTASATLPPAPPSSSGTGTSLNPLCCNASHSCGAQPAASASPTSCQRLCTANSFAAGYTIRVTHDKPLTATERSTSLVPPRMVNDGASSTARRNSRSNNDGVCTGARPQTSSGPTTSAAR